MSARLPLDQLLPEVSAARMAATVAALVADRFAGRRTGSAGNAAARAWLGGVLDGVGGHVGLSPFAVRAVPEVYAAPAVRCDDGLGVRDLTFGRQAGIHAASADLPLPRRAGLAVAGHGTAGQRWLLVPADMRLFDAYGDSGGAAGLLLSRAADADGWLPIALAGSEAGPLPVLTLDAETHAALTAAARAGTGWVEASAPIRRLDLPAANLHTVVRSAAEPMLDVLLTAHYDGVGDLPGLRQPGAADNASGVAVVLEAARVLAGALPDGVRLSVALLDAEEIGARGSAHHAAELIGGGSRPVVLNVDGAGLLHGPAAVEAGGPAHGLLAMLDQAGRSTGVALAPGPVASDNRRYAAAGLAAVGIGAGMAGYHSPADTPDRVEPAALEAIARLVVATVWLAAETPARLSSSIGDGR